METHVLLPPELILSVRPKSDDCTSPVVARFLEQSVTVVTRTRLEKGFQIHPAPINSTVRSGKLDIYSTLPTNDVSNSDEYFNQYYTKIAFSENQIIYHLSYSVIL